MKPITAPYPGLRPFERHEDILFFGREEQVDQLLDKLADTHFLAVLGASGSGKSSLVKAGLLPALDSGYMAGAGARWAVAELRPGDRPFRRLADSLIRDTDWGGAYGRSLCAETAVGGDDDRADPAPAVAALENDLRRGSLALNWRLGVQPLTAGTRLLLLVDQFEELFRFHRGAEAEAAAFTALLLGAATHPDVYVVITMRAEFLRDCSLYPDLPEAINAGLFLTPSLTPEQMADAVELPARLPQFAGKVDPDLTRRLLNEARGRNDQLPLLQHALMRMWNRTGEEKHLTLKGLEELGGLDGCLDAHVEEAYLELNPERRRIAEVMFRALTERSSDKRDIRRPASLGEIAELAGVEPDDTGEVVDVFRRPGRSFLMPPAGTELKDDTVLDVTHEALIRQWHRLQQWTANEAEQAELYLRLESAAQRHREGKGALWIDPDLEYALQWREEQKPTKEWAARYGGDFHTAMEFLQAGRKQRDAQREAEERRRNQEIRKARIIAVVSIAALIITIVLSVWALYERNHAVKAEQTARDHAIERTRSLFDSSVTHASLLAKLDDPAGAREVLRKTAKLDRDISESRRHTRNLLAGYVDIMGGAADKAYEGAGAVLIDVAVSPDGRLLAAAGERGSLVLFDAETGELLKRLEGHDASAGKNGSVSAVVFGPKGAVLYSGGEDKRIIRWSMPDGEKQGEWDAPNEVWALALSPDGNTLAGGGNGDGITIWDTSTGKKTRTLKGRTSLISDGTSLAFSPDGQWLVSGGYNDEVGVWDMSTFKERALPGLHTEQVSAVAVSPDGQWIATGGADKRIVLWDAKGGRPIRTLRGHENIVFDLAFDGESRRLFSACRDRTMRLWDVATGVPMRIYQGHTAGLRTVAHYGGALYTAADDGAVRRWSSATPGQWVWKMEGEPQACAVSPDGAFVMVGFRDGALRVYALPNCAGEKSFPRQWAPALLAEVKNVHGSGGINRIKFNSAGTLFATAGMDDQAKVWHIDRNTYPTSLTLLHTMKGHTHAVHDVAFSPDGRVLATASYDGKVGLFDVESGKGKLFDAHEGRNYSISNDSRGAKLVTTSENRRLIVWDVVGLELKKKRTIDLQDKGLWAALRPDGRQIAAVGRELVVALHDLGPDVGLPRKLAGHDDTVFRAVYSPDGTQLATASADMTVRLWDLGVRKALFTLRLPTEYRWPSPLWDFDFRCVPDGNCWLAVPLAMGRLALYRLPYEQPPASIAPKKGKEAP